MHQQLNNTKDMTQFLLPLFVGLVVLVSPLSASAQYYDDAGDGCCGTFIDTYTPPSDTYIDTYTPPAATFIDTYTPPAYTITDTYTPPSYQITDSYTPPASSPSSGFSSVGYITSGGSATGGSGYVSGGVGSGSGASFYYPGFSSGGHTVTGGGLSSSPVTFVYPAWSTSTHEVIGGGITSPAVTFNYPDWATSEHYVSGGVGGVNFTSSSYSGYAAPTCWLSVSPQYINPGQSATINWTSNNASSGYIPGIGTVFGSGQGVVSPSQTTQYTATFTGPGGSTNCYGTVVVQGGLVASAIAPRAPSVTLSQVPYTGLDLGPVGTILYWLGLVLLCALLAYLIAVRQIQNVFLGWLAVRIFGDSTIPTHPAYAYVEDVVQEEIPAAYVRSATLAQKQASDYVDPFILHQIFPVGN